MVRPIPRSLLPDMVIYREKNEEDGFYGGDYKEDITLSYVRVDETSTYSQSNLSDGEKFSHLMFYDVVNSKASNDFSFKVKSQVEWNNQMLTVQKVNTLRTQFGRIHHYELELST